MTNSTTTAIKRDRQALVDLLTSHGATFQGDKVFCPYHPNDKTPAGGIYEDNGHFRYKCFACEVSGDYFDLRAMQECKTSAQVIKELGGACTPITRKTTQSKPQQPRSIEDIRAGIKGTIEAEYTYQTQAGELAGVIIRYRTDTGKSFLPVTPAGNGLFITGAMPTPRPLYNLPEVIEAKTVIVCEGEKCVDALTRYGITATTSAGGANAAKQTDWKPLAAKTVVLWPDFDHAGEKYINDVKAQLAGLDCELSQIEPADLDLVLKEDAADFIAQLEAVHKQDTEAIKAELVKAISKAKPVSEWPELMPLESCELPEFPLHIFPDPIAAYIEAVSQSYFVPVDMPAMLALATTAAAIQGKATIRPLPDWKETASLYVCVLMNSGQRKSPVLKEILRPIQGYEINLKEQKSPMLAEAKTQREILDKQRRDAVNSGEAEKAFAIDIQLSVLPDIHEPRLLVDNSTSEQLAILMSRNNGRMALFSAEADAIQNIAGRYSEGSPDCNLYLKSFSGDPLTYDRVSREPVRVDNPALTIGLCVQPTIIEGLQHKSHFKNVGLLPRFLFSVPANQSGNEPFRKPQVPVNLRQYYNDVITGLLTLWPGQSEAAEIGLSPDAEDVFAAYFEAFSNPEDALTEWRAKLRGQMLRVAACVSFLRGEYVSIGVEAMAGAISLSGYLEAHAKAAYGLLEADSELKIVERIAKWIARHDKPEFSKSELWQFIKSKGDTADILERPLEILTGRGYVLPVIDNKTTGGRKAEQYKINPKIEKGEKGERVQQYAPGNQ